MRDIPPRVSEEQWCIFFFTGGVLSVTLYIVDMWQYYVCCILSGVTARFMAGAYVPQWNLCGMFQ